MILVATPGDPAGIGPEIVWKSILAQVPRKHGAHLLCIGARAPFDELGARVIELSPHQLESDSPLRPPVCSAPFVWLLPAPVRSSGLLAGFQSGWSIERAVELVRRGRAQALVTGPISKERLKDGGYRFPGHTELLARLCHAEKVTMMLANESLRISLVTTHLPYNEVPRALTRQEIRRAILHTVTHLQAWWGIRKPRVAIAALNPHAGENGLFGDEEIRLLSPVIRALQKSGQGSYELLGPLPADTLFANHLSAAPKSRYDAVVCMYHDQGLIPVKLVDFKNTVNITLGLPIIRTSVDHGVAFDIAGKGVADPSSFQAAVALAARLARKGRPLRTHNKTSLRRRVPC
ncbi:MAG: 4-hydroxythreonine-4-phosphate dehydrogenase PdxA [Oligoflexia bacterium]|nr:4-hydroxythreonine-4-phosphate dehydrogenase PdxA [Oligoflexia bacterium]